MIKLFIYTIFSVIFLAMNLEGFKVHAENSNFQQTIYPITECNDGVDNDGDGGIDFAFDPECTSWEDNNELPDVVVSYPPNPPEQIEQPQSISSGLQSIATQLPTTSRLGRIVQQFIWQPIASVLGISSNIGELNSEEINTIINNGFAVGVSYIVIGISVSVYFFKFRKR